MIRFTVRVKAAVAAAAFVTPAATAGAEFEFFLVESFNTEYDLAETGLYGINASNIGVGQDTFGGFIWTEADGKIQLPWNSSKGINDSGWINYGNVIYNYQTEQQVTIPAPSAAYPIRSLIDLSDAMVGVGVSSHGGPGCEPFDCPYDCGKAFVWDEVNGSRHLPVPDLKALHAVNNNGVAVGVIIVNCDDNRGVVYDLQTGEWTNLSDLLPPLVVVGRPAQVWPTDINDAGQVIGLATSGTEPEKPFVWTEADGFVYLPTIPGGAYGYMRVNSINNEGVVVGEALDEVAFEWKAFVWDAQNGIRVLADLVDEPTDFQMNDAFAVNDNGWIVGRGHFGPGWATSRGYVLKAVGQATPGDLNGDGAVDGADLAILLGQWGASGGAPGSADLNNDGGVDGADLAMLLGLWS